MFTMKGIGCIGLTMDSLYGLVLSTRVGRKVCIMSKLTPTFIYQQKKFKLKEFTKSQEKFLQVQNTAMASGQHEFSANN